MSCFKTQYDRHHEATANRKSVWKTDTFSVLAAYQLSYSINSEVLQIFTISFFNAQSSLLLGILFSLLEWIWIVERLTCPLVPYLSTAYPP